MDIKKIEEKWITCIQEKSNSDKDLTVSIINTIAKLPKKIPDTIDIDTINFTKKEIMNIKTQLTKYKIPRVYIAYIDGVESRDIKKGFSKNDVIFYVVDDSTQIVELMVNEYYVLATYIIPKKYLDKINIDNNTYYKINNYKKLISISNIIKDYKKYDKAIKNPVHDFIFTEIINSY